jgi:hypothetical protein
MKYVLTLLVVLFAFGDLIGKRNLGNLERRWLSVANRLIVTWRSTLSDSRSWLIGLGAIALALLAATILSVAPFFAFYFIQSPWAIVVASTYLISVPVGFVISYGVVAWAVKADSQSGPPVEFAFFQYTRDWVDTVWNDLSSIRIGKGKATFGLFFVFSFLLGPIMFSVATVGLITRVLLYAATLIGWVAAFGPPVALNWVAQRTGAESYFNVGKYFLLVAATVYTWLTGT